MNRSGEEQERVLLYLEEEARKKHRRKLPVKNEEKWKGAGRGHWVGMASPCPPLPVLWAGLHPAPGTAQPWWGWEMSELSPSHGCCRRGGVMPDRPPPESREGLWEMAVGVMGTAASP